ncbi:MAG: outer membrane beta-barrel protein, partial [Vicinamibacteria bacterium]
DRLEVVATESGVSVLLHVPPEVSIDLRRDRRGLLLVFREASAAAAPPAVARATPPATPPAAPPPVRAPAPEPTILQPEPPAAPATPQPAPAPVATAPVAPTPAPVVSPPAPAAEAPAAAVDPTPAPAPPTETAALARGLFPAATAVAALQASPGASSGSVNELYAQLFPSGAPKTRAETVQPTVELTEGDPGVPFGPFRVQGSVDVRYVDADTFVEATGEPVRDSYLEVVPRLAATAPVSDGRVSIDYTPYLRAFATFPQVNRNSHRLSLGLDLPVGPSVVFNVKDSFVSGTLDTREVDPGGEYFFGLGQFRKNTISGGASILVGPRTSLELQAGATALRFQEESNFFDYDTRIATAGLGYEVSPNLKAILAYSYDEMPAPSERPEAEASAHNARLTFTGDIMPLLNGRLTVGFRDQKSPNAGEGGQRYTGFTMGGSLTRQFSRKSDVTLFVNRSTPASAFENNAFYVFTALQGSGRFPLPWQLQVQGGVGYQWNDYRTVSEEIGAPREDRILAWYVGLRRPIGRQLFLSATYRQQDRSSNIDRFDIDAEGFILQLGWNIFGYTP